MGNATNLGKPILLSTNDMISEITIGKAQLRCYVKDGRLKARKIRNRIYATREDFNDFKQVYGF